MTKEHEPTETPGTTALKATKVASRSLQALAICAVVTLLYFAREVFVPIALALLFALILSSTVEALKRRGLKRPLGALLLLFIMLTVIGLTVNAIAGPAEQWFANLPQTVQAIEHKVRPVRQVIGRLEDITSRAETMAEPNAGVPRAAPVVPATQPAAAPVSALSVLLKTRAGLVSTGTVIILTLFLLSGGPPMLARMTATVADDLHSVHALKVIEAIRSELGRYYGTIALINLGLGTATGIVMMMLGVPNAFLWGTMAAILNFIPYVGSATTLLVLTVVAVVTFDAVGRMFAVAASYLLLATIEGQVVQPLFVGHRLSINPLVVFLAIWIGGWMWGIPGIIIAVPGLVALKVGAEHSRGNKALLAFLGADQSKPVIIKRIAVRAPAKKA